MQKTFLTAANALTAVRILCALLLCFCPAFSKRFYAVYLLGGASDILDGIAARHSGKASAFGARFDTAADIVFTAVMLIKVIRAVSFPVWLIVWIVCIAVLKGINILCGFVLYKRFVTEHTVWNRLCGVLLFALPFCIGGLLPRIPTAPLFLPVCVTATLAAVQEGYYIRIGYNMD